LARHPALQDTTSQFQIRLSDAGFEQKEDGEVEVWTGTVSGDYYDEILAKQTHFCHKVAIVLLESFPYQAPVVLSKDDQPLKLTWHLIPGQLQGLCLWGEDDGWKPYYSAQKLLARIQEWFCHYHVGTWPENSEMPDLHRYLECIGTVAISDSWNPSELEDTGTFSFWKPVKYLDLTLGLATTTQGGQPISRELPSDSIESQLFFIERGSAPQAGVWFRLKKPFVPPDNLGDLLTLVDSNLEKPEGWSSKICSHTVGLKVDTAGFPLALGYADLHDKIRWMFLWVDLSQDKKKRHKIGWTNHNLQRKHRLQSFRTAPARYDDLLKRTAHLSNSLGTKRVIIFGLGSLGGCVALQLAKAGMGQLRLVDNDVILPGNVIRHVCGLNWSGMPKTTAVGSHIKRHNPKCQAETLGTTWSKSKLADYIKGCDLVVDTTANNNFSLLLNEVCIEHGFPAIFATAYRQATIGRLIVWRHTDDPCLACYVDARRNWDESDYPIIPALETGSLIEDGCGGVTQEAAAIDVEAVANLVARTAVKFLQNRLDDHNLALLINEPVGESEMLSQEGTHWRQNSPSSTCRICRL
jgi:molybdopterin/thiamine biosynthesis adenylyltransferase